MTPRQKLAEAVRPHAPNGRLGREHVTAFDAFADVLGLPRDSEFEEPLELKHDATRAYAIEHLRFEEGVIPNAYRDHLGYWTIGVGRLIDPRRGGRITQAEERVLLRNDPSRKAGDWNNWVLRDDEIDLLLLNDIEHVERGLAKHPGLKDAWAAVQGNTYRETALISMAFQMGIDGLAGFRNSMRMVANRQFTKAGRNVLRSLWARQTPKRARRVSRMIATGKAP